MFIPRSYVPILTGKAGEFQALADLDEDIKLAMFPMIQMPPVPEPRSPRVGEPPGPREPPEASLIRFLNRMQGKWTEGRRMMMDLDAFAHESVDGRSATEWLFQSAYDREMWLMAAVTTDSRREYRQALHDSSRWLRGLCLRAKPRPDMAPSELVDTVKAVQEDLPETDPACTELMLDLGRLRDLASTEKAVRELALEHLQALTAAGLKPTAVAGSVVPAQSPSRDGMEVHPRWDRRLWEWLGKQPVGAQLAFADYGATGPYQGPGGGFPDPNIRYSTRAALLMWRGKLSTRVDPDDPNDREVTFAELCRKLVARNEFAGAKYSAGDLAYSRNASGRQHDRGATKWVQFAASHHLTHVVREVVGD